MPLYTPAIHGIFMGVNRFMGMNQLFLEDVPEKVDVCGEWVAPVSSSLMFRWTFVFWHPPESLLPTVGVIAA